MMSVLDLQKKSERTPWDTNALPCAAVHHCKYEQTPLLATTMYLAARSKQAEITCTNNVYFYGFLKLRPPYVPTAFLLAAT
jgi:hypothetical protein